MEGSVTHLMNIKKIRIRRKKEHFICTDMIEVAIELISKFRGYTDRLSISNETQTILFSSNATAVKISYGNMKIFWLVPCSPNMVNSRDYKNLLDFTIYSCTLRNIVFLKSSCLAAIEKVFNRII